MNTNTMELNLNEMAAVNGGDTKDHVTGAVVGATVGGILGAGVGTVFGAPGVIFGTIAGATGGGVTGGALGFNRIKNWFKSILPNKN